MFRQSFKIDSTINFAQNSRLLLIILLILLSSAGLVGSDICLPSFPVIAKDLNVSNHHIQITLGVYLFGLALGQIIIGPITEKFGRKKPLIYGMGLYLVASILCASVSQYHYMLIFRLMQSLGACSGLIIGRTIVGDLFDKKEGARIFATVFPFVGMTPAVSPVIGGYIGFYFGWRSTFLLVGLYAFLLLWLVIIYLPETLSPNHRNEISLAGTKSSYQQILFNKKFIAYCIAPCSAYIAYFAYITEAPFMFYSLGYSQKEIGTFYILLSLTYVFGSLFSKKLLKNKELDSIIRSGYKIFNLGAFMLILSGFFDLPFYFFIISASILTLGNGYLIPLGTAGVISLFPRLGGYSSGLLGFFQLGSTAVSSSIVNIISQGKSLNLGLYITFITLSAALSFSLLNKKKKLNIPKP